jgi:hypothetical protein
MYFSARANVSPYRHCVGAATSPSITTPFTPLPHSMFCPQDSGGAIDASGFRDPGTGHRYVLYKIDGNALGHGGSCNNFIGPIVPTPIILQRVWRDGITVAEGHDAVEILNRDARDGPLVESPSLMYRSGRYFLFYSSNCWSSDEYDVSWAVSEPGADIRGPYEKAGTLFETGMGELVAPGGASIAADGTHMVFHAKVNGKRAMFTAWVKTVGRQLAGRVVR